MGIDTYVYGICMGIGLTNIIRTHTIRRTSFSVKSNSDERFGAAVVCVCVPTSSWGSCACAEGMGVGMGTGWCTSSEG
ncbi:hypothetical protein EON63_11680 [archaeon]|nr:MAG: hypothetical protein EON63_11680 [archaeon]